jgi:hypothetical protein
VFKKQITAYKNIMLRDLVNPKKLFTTEITEKVFNVSLRDLRVLRGEKSSQHYIGNC